MKKRKNTLQHLKLGKLKCGIHKIGFSMSWTRYLFNWSRNGHVKPHFSTQWGRRGFRSNWLTGLGQFPGLITSNTVIEDQCRWKQKKVLKGFLIFLNVFLKKIKERIDTRNTSNIFWDVSFILSIHIMF